MQSPTGKLPLVQGYDSILVVVDRFTKIAHFIPTTEKTSAERLTQLLEIIFGSYTDYQIALFQIKDHNSWQIS